MGILSLYSALLGGRAVMVMPGHTYALHGAQLIPKGANHAAAHRTRRRTRQNSSSSWPPHYPQVHCTWQSRLWHTASIRAKCKIILDFVIAAVLSLWQNVSRVKGFRGEKSGVCSRLNVHYLAARMVGMLAMRSSRNAK